MQQGLHTDLGSLQSRAPTHDLCHAPIIPTHRSSLSSLFCPWVMQRWCCPAAQTGCPESWPGRSGNHFPPRSPGDSLPSPSEMCCLWACSWWICVRRDLWGKEAKSWSCLAKLPPYISNRSQDQNQIKDLRGTPHQMEMARMFLFQWQTLAACLAPGGCKLMHSFYLWNHLDQYPHATRMGNAGSCFHGIMVCSLIE